MTQSEAPPSPSPSEEDQRAFLQEAAGLMAEDWEENVKQIALTAVLLTEAAGRELEELLDEIRGAWSEWGSDG